MQLGGGEVQAPAGFDRVLDLVEAHRSTIVFATVTDPVGKVQKSLEEMELSDRDKAAMATIAERR